MAAPIPPAAQVVYTTNVLTSPQFVGGLVALALVALRWLGMDVADNPQTQDMISLAIGWGVGAGVKWFFPRADGRLGLTAPAAWSVPAPQNVPVGASVVTVPARSEAVQVATVTPVEVGKQVVTVKGPTAAKGRAEAAPMEVAVSPARGG